MHVPQYMVSAMSVDVALGGVLSLPAPLRKEALCEASLPA